MLIGGLWAASNEIRHFAPLNRLMNHPVMGELLNKWNTVSEKNRNERIYLQVDKPIVEPGDDIWFTAYVRDGETLKPSNISDIVHIELINPKGAKEKELNLIAQKGVVNGDFQISEDMAGGLYKIKAWTKWQTNDSSFFEKEIQVQDLIAPDILVKFNFSKSSYGAGEDVNADIELRNQQQQIIATNVQVNLLVENKIVLTKSIQTNNSGKTDFTAKLPESINSNDVNLKLSWEIDGLKDSYTRNVPVTLNKLKVDFFPEGGDAVAGVTNRIAFRAVDLNGKPAELSGKLLINNKEVSNVSTYHQGRGSFSIIPNEKDKVVLQLEKPFKQEIPVVLTITDAGFAMSCSSPDKNNISISINSTLQDSIYLVMQCRTALVYSQSHALKKGENKINISTSSLPVGVHQVTLFDSKGIERCERLIFVNKGKNISIDIATDKNQYQPREKVKLTLQVKDERGLPVPAALSVAVIKESLFQEVKNNPSNLLSSLLLEQELQAKVEEPGFYFNPKEAKADTALDYLLLTEGWRRFTWTQVREDEVAAFSIAPEKAIITGRVMNGSTYQGFTGVSIKQNGKIIGTTDVNGNYTLKNILLYTPAQLEFHAQNFPAQQLSASTYGQQAEIYMYDQNYFLLDNQMVPAGAMERNIDMEEDGMVKQKRANVQRVPMAVPAEKPAVEFKKEDRREQAKPVEKAPLKLEAKAVVENRIVAGEVDDLKLARRGPGNNRPVQPQVTYYRGRTYAVQVPKSFAEAPRSDFRNTVYWSGAVLVDKTGKSTLEFYNSDDIASFRITAEGISVDGLPGRQEKVFSTVLPLSLRVNIPGECTAGDQLFIPVTIKNNTGSGSSTNIKIKVPAHLKTAMSTIPVSLTAGENKTVYVSVQALEAGRDSIKISLQSGIFTDEINVPVKVISRGFPYQVSVSGKEKSKEFRFDMKDVVKGSAYTTFSAYPDVVSDLMKGVESIIREPYGCFEQTSTSNYPNVMAKLYLKESGTKSDKEKYLDEVLDKGYKRLTSYETRTKGYEWFGGSPAHEALTAYGLMQFKDMQKAYGNVDDAMIARTAEWLYGRRDGNGGFKRSAQALDEFGRADDAISNAYIVYSLSEAGFKDITKELNTSEDIAKKDQDPYVLAMITQALYNVGEKKRGDALLGLLLKKQNNDGSWNGARHSITRSEGISLRVETTSLAVLALLKSENPDAKALESGIKSIMASRSGYGGFGSTQGTILALKALTRYASFMKQTNENGTIEIRINKQLAGTKKYEAGERNEIKLADMEKFLKDGENTVEIRFVGVSNPLPFSMSIGWNTTKPSSDNECKVDLTTSLASKKTTASSLVRLTAVLKNKTSEGLPMTMAEIGIPAGLQAQAWQLKELQDQKLVDFYEITGNRVVLYYRQMKPNESREVNLDLKAAVPGIYEGQASSAYLYYTAEHKKWVNAMNVEITK